MDVSLVAFCIHRERDLSLPSGKNGPVVSSNRAASVRGDLLDFQDSIPLVQ